MTRLGLLNESRPMLGEKEMLFKTEARTRAIQ